MQRWPLPLPLPLLLPATARRPARAARCEAHAVLGANRSAPAGAPARGARPELELCTSAHTEDRARATDASVLFQGFGSGPTSSPVGHDDEIEPVSRSHNPRTAQHAPPIEPIEGQRFPGFSPAASPQGA